MNMQDKMLIDGELIEGEGAALPVLNPATGEEITQVKQVSTEQVALAMRSSETAFHSFSQTTPAARSALLLDIADKLENHAAELAELESLNVGKPWPSALDDEMPLTIDTFRFFAGAARTMTGSAALALWHRASGPEALISGSVTVTVYNGVAVAVAVYSLPPLFFGWQIWCFTASGGWLEVLTILFHIP